jgi:hypothetical protein
MGARLNIYFIDIAGIAATEIRHENIDSLTITVHKIQPDGRTAGS